MTARERAVAALLLFLAGGVPAPALALRRLAVLTPTAPWSAPCADSARQKDERLQERCTLLDAVADEARAGALAALGAGEIAVMTRENTAQILAESGATCTEGECEVETARLIGAELVVSGNLVLFGDTFLLTLKLHDVKTARLLRASDRVEGNSAIEIFRAARRSSEAMVREGMGAGPVPKSGASVEPPSPWSATARGSWAFPLGPRLANGSGPGSLPVFGATVGRRTSDGAAFELIGEIYGIADMGIISRRETPLGQLEAKVWGAWALAGAEVALSRGGVITAAAGLGGGVLNARLEAGLSNADVVDESRFVPAALVELRASRGFGGIELGFAAGASGYYLPTAPRAVTIPGGTESIAIEKGFVLLPRVTVLARIGL